MFRTLLNHLPDWLLFLIILGIAIAIAVGGLVVVRRFLPAWRTDESAGVVAAVGAMVMTLFALVLAFVSVNLYESLQDARLSVSAEANSLSEIAHDVNVLSPSDQVRVKTALANYAYSVVHGEFPAMRRGDSDTRTSTELAAVFSAMQKADPKTEAQTAFYESAVGELNSVVADRLDRLDDADSSLPGAFIALLLLTALISLITTFFFKVETPGLEIMLVAAVAIVIAAGLLTVLLLEYPFSGSISVSSDPFTRGAIGELVTQFAH